MKNMQTSERIVVLQYGHISSYCILACSLYMVIYIGNLASLLLAHCFESVCNHFLRSFSVNEPKLFFCTTIFLPEQIHPKQTFICSRIFVLLSVVLSTLLVYWLQACELTGIGRAKQLIAFIEWESRQKIRPLHILFIFDRLN